MQQQTRNIQPKTPGARLTLVPVVLFGGNGTRLWPVSRESLPKPFMKLPDGESLLCKTYKRAFAAVEGSGFAKGELLSVTNRDHYFMGKDELALAVPSATTEARFMLEPEGRDTAPAIALAALAVRDLYGPDALMLVLASDHLIEDEAGFNEAVRQAARLASNGWLVTFGVRPDSPHTGYGYIEAGEALSGAAGAGRRARRFVEKPSLERAEAYLASGNFFWNSGMFCMSAASFLQALATCASDIGQAAVSCWQATQARQDQPRSIYELTKAEFAAIPARSVDFAVMEKADNIAVLPADFGWRDIGSWDAFKDLVASDKQGNRTLGQSLFIESHNNFVMSEARLTALVGVENLTVIDTSDALLVVHPDKVQAVKNVVEALRAQQNQTYKEHKTAVRPWGSYTVLEEGPGFKIKRIEVKPGAALSLQRHKYRSEHWVVVSGQAHVVNGEQDLLIRTDESTFIPAGCIHRLANPSDEELIIIEVQSGSYLGEDDIERLEDIYNRGGNAP